MRSFLSPDRVNLRSVVALVKPKPAVTERRRIWSQFVLPAGWMLAITLASDQPKLPSPSGIPSFDKIAHFGAYGLLATLWVRAFVASGRPMAWAAWVGWAVAAAFGMTDEIHQSFVPGRSIELADWLADASGAAVAALLYIRWAGYRRLLERRVAPSAAVGGEPSAGAAAYETHS